MSRATDAEKPEPVPFGKPSLGVAEEDAVLRVMRSGWLTTGSECRSFEQEFARAVDMPHAIAVSSATAGLHLALEAAGVKPGDRVVTTPLTFAATAEVICSLGADPVFADIDPDTGNISAERAAHAVEQSQAAALIPVHLGGLTCQMQPLQAIASGYRCSLIEDAAHSFPGGDEHGYAGTQSDFGVYSFYANKTITTGEGGMVVTRDTAAARRMQLLRNHGIDRDVWHRFTDTRASWRYDITAAGFKYNMPDLAAAIGRVQLGKARELQQKRRAIANRYLNELRDCEFLQLPPDAPDHSYHLFQIRLRTGILSIDRDEFINRLQQQGIGTSVHYIPLHIMSYYRDRYDLKPSDFPHALDWYERCISLPIYPDLEDSQIDRILDAVRGIGRSCLKGLTASSNRQA
ncbi:DegT/DnrJ/EryC1/StrS family aminotransferase [Spirochaeta africana]|uniref:Putative PLP-dependent enzyme possibly involved in cell wall biogenesis n=1 Tax=Spirochaeta africana (strain ATCC 700263 / DSM 8902 / Z-7692) TaxID=889378 RepID=H9UL64_SPIAZ|nr:DegT/DnrJ/EryC1/StrS aminotransferase family protein [Spirochaeta africana]AFG38257.1 putative PLP-dependent enzyme possibly involved in cell wall biogenesis [Spirochaeta africana DSM 8902]